MGFRDTFLYVRLICSLQMFTKQIGNCNRNAVEAPLSLIFAGDVILNSGWRVVIL